jgi:hypothetical protein
VRFLAHTALTLDVCGVKAHLRIGMKDTLHGEPALGEQPEARPALAATGVSEVSRFSCMKFLSVFGVCDYAEPFGNFAVALPPCCLPHTWTASAL